MASFVGRAELVGPSASSADIRASFHDDRLAVWVGDHLLGDWHRSEIAVSRRGDGFLMQVSGETLLLEVDDPDGFWNAVSGVEQSLITAVESIRPPAVAHWWKFWQATAWRAWWSRRTEWVAYRRRTRALDAEVSACRNRLDHAVAGLTVATQDLAWASEATPRSLPVRMAAKETGLATVAGVTLRETRKNNGVDTWTDVDTGSVHFTDRKLVFAGSKNVEFRYDKLTLVEAGPGSVHLGVSTRKRTHMLAGPSQRLAALITASRAFADGRPATDPAESRVAELTSDVARERSEFDRLTRVRAELAVPARPVSPAWLPAAVALLMVSSFSAGSATPATVTTPSVPDVAAASPVTTATPVTSSPNPTTATTSLPTTLPSSTVAPAPVTTVTTTSGELAATAVDGDLVVSFFDVGQGDSTLLLGPDFTIVIDAGRHDRNDVTGLLRGAGVAEIDLLVGTHPHADHIGQVDDVLATFGVTEVWMSGDSHTTATYERVLDAILESGAGYHEPRTGETYTIGSARVEVLNPPAVNGDLHLGSLGLRVVYGDVAFIFTGDAEAPAEQMMVSSGLGLAAQVFKVGHHGSASSTSARFLEAVSPAVAVYSAAAGNQYGHPHPETIERLTARGVEVYGTDVHGTVRVTTDGRTWTVATGSVASVLPVAPTTTAAPSTTVTTEAEVTVSSCDVGQVDINRAGFEELQRIIHIGPDRAQQILDLRPFSSVDSMDRIKGIAEARLADIKAQGIACVG